MSSDQLRRLRLRLTAYYSVATLVAVAVLAVIAVVVADQRLTADLDAKVRSRVLDSNSWAYNDSATTDNLFVERASFSDFGPGKKLDPPALVIDERGKLVAGLPRAMRSTPRPPRKREQPPRVRN